VDKLTTGKSNFENVLASHNCVLGKTGLGFYPQSKENGISKPFSSVSEKQSIKRMKQQSCYMFLLYEERSFS